MSGLILSLLSFLIGAFALKLAISVSGKEVNNNNYSTALSVSAGLGVVGFLLGFFPVVGLIFYAILWVAVVMGVYQVGALRSLGVAFLQVVIRLLIMGFLSLIGVGAV